MFDNIFITALFLDIIFFVIGFPFFILFFSFFKKADRGYALSKVFGFVFLSFIVWSLSFLGIHANTVFFVRFLFLFVFVISFVLFFKYKKKFLKKLKSVYKLLIIEEFVFFISLLWMLFIRSNFPDLVDIEKFMDTGFVASYLRSETLPAFDMWFALKPINYYSYGHFLTNILCKLTGVWVNYGFNFMFSYIFAQSILVVFSFFELLFEKVKSLKIRTFLSIIGVIFTVFGTNSYVSNFYLQVLSGHKKMSEFWYPTATRFIENTIHEFVAYSFIVDDLHAHIINIFISFSIFYVLYLWTYAILKEEKNIFYVFYSQILGLLFGFSIITNTWDFLNFSIIISFLSIFILFYDFSKFKKVFISALIILTHSIFISLSWALHFKSISQGIDFVKDPTPIDKFLYIWSNEFIFAIAVIFLSIKILNKKIKKVLTELNIQALYALSLSFSFLFMVFIPEVVYVKDIYTSFYRANTMFKIVFQAINAIHIAFAWWIGVLFIYFRKNKNKLKFLVLNIIIFVFSIVYISYTLMGYRDYIGVRLFIPPRIKLAYKHYKLIDFKKQRTLDGFYWMKKQNDFSYKAISFLNENITGQVNILEAYGESYSKNCNISAFTGLPTIVGWKVHEWLWRGGLDEVLKREKEVKTIYEYPDSRYAKELIKKYDIHFIIVGEKERKKFKIDENDIKVFKNMGTVVLDDPHIFIVKVK